MDEIILYGGDAANIDQLSAGDVMTIELINEGIKELLDEAYFSKQRISAFITNTQLLQITPKMEGTIAMLYFLPVKNYESSAKIQEAILTCGRKVVKIYTSKA